MKQPSSVRSCSVTSAEVEQFPRLPDGLTIKPVGAGVAVCVRACVCACIFFSFKLDEIKGIWPVFMSGKNRDDMMCSGTARLFQSSVS